MYAMAMSFFRQIGDLTAFATLADIAASYLKVPVAGTRRLPRSHP
jgi:hypothetical protein